MIHKLKFPAIVTVCSLIGLWSVNSVFKYFSHSALPEVSICGIEKGGTCAGIVSCAIKSDNSYKVAGVDIFLDGKELEIKNLKKISAKKFEVPFRLDTLNFANGKHEIEINSVDASFGQNKNQDKYEFFVDNVPLKSAFLQSEYKVDQGRTIHAKIQVNKQLKKAQIKFLENFYECYPESEYSTVYESFIPVDCELSADEHMMTAELQDHVGNCTRLSSKAVVNAAHFPKQRGFTVAEGKLEEERDISMSNKILEDALEKWVLDSPKKKFWAGNFEVPLDLKRIATPFGEIRTSAQKGRYLHKAVDILNLPKCVVWTAQDGRVIIKDRYLMSGNTVVVDHGLGVFTLYYHLEDFADVEVGDYLKKGNPIGRMGMTGYANGYHLHWELRVNNVAVDPFEWTKKTF